MTLFAERMNMLVCRGGRYELIRPDAEGRDAYYLLQNLELRLKEQRVGCELPLCYYLIKSRLMARFLIDTGPDDGLADWPNEARKMYTTVVSFFREQPSKKAAVIALSKGNNLRSVDAIIAIWLQACWRQGNGFAGDQVLKLLTDNQDIVALKNEDNRTDGFWAKPPKKAGLTEEQMKDVRKKFSPNGSEIGANLADVLIKFIENYGFNKENYAQEMVAVALDWLWLARTEQPSLADHLFHVEEQSSSDHTKFMWLAVTAAGVDLSLESGVPFPSAVGMVGRFLEERHMGDNDLIAMAGKLEKPDYGKWINELQVS